MKVKINLNDFVKVKLTDYGKEIYYHRFDELGKCLGKEDWAYFPKEDEEGKSKFQLWDFIQLYGNYIGMARPNVIEPLDIEFEVKEEAEQTKPNPMEQMLDLFKNLYLQNKDEVDKVAHEYMASMEVDK